jgi:hypothetical protein
MKKNSILSVLIIICVYFAVFTLTSCNKDENPVNTKNESGILDSNVFEWHFDTIYTNPYGDSYIADTNQIVIPGSPYSIYINNGSIEYINHNDNGFVCYCANGTSINNVYLGGIDGPTSKPKLKKWNGGGIVDIPIPDSISACIQNIVPISENDIWMSTNKNIIFHFANNIFEKYYLENGYEAGLVYKDIFNNLYAQYIKFSLGSYYFVTVFKLENNYWRQVTRDSINDNTEMGDYIGFSGDKILRRGKSSIYSFTGYSWEIYINVPSKIDYIYVTGGGSAENILFHGRDNYNITNPFLFYYNGNTFFRISNHIFPNLAFAYIQFKYNRYYISTNDYSFENIFMTAKLKK